MSTTTSTQPPNDDPSRWMRQQASRPLGDEWQTASVDAEPSAAFDPLYEVRILETGEVMVLPKEERTKRERGEHKRISEEFRMIKRPLLMNAFERRHDGDSPFKIGRAHV